MLALQDPGWERSAGGSEPTGSSKRGVDLEAFYFSVGHGRGFFGLLIGCWVAAGIVSQLALESGGAAQRSKSALPTAGTTALTAGPIGISCVHWYRPALGALGSGGGGGGLIGLAAVTQIFL